MKFRFSIGFWIILLLFVAACGSDDTPEPDTTDDTVQTTDDSDGTDSTDDNSSSDDGDDTDDPASTLEIDYIESYYADALWQTEAFIRVNGSDLIDRHYAYDHGYNYTYDERGRLIRSVINWDYPNFQPLDVEYEGDRVRRTRYSKITDDFWIDIETDVISIRDYTAVDIHRDPITGEERFRVNYQINISLDGEQRVTYFRRTNLEDNTVATLEIRYEDGNLTRMIFNGETPGLQYEYDDSPNMLALLPGIPSPRRRDILELSAAFSGLLPYMPQMMHFKNKNNFKRKWNTFGEVVDEWEFQYNEYGHINYIKRINWPEGTYERVEYVVD